MNSIKRFTLYVCLVISMTQLAYSATWQRINIGGGGAMNVVGAGPTGTMVVGTDLAGAYIKRLSDSQWQMIGPLNGLFDTHITGLAFDHSDANIIMLATEGGIYRSDNGGRNFKRVDHPPSSTNLYGGKFTALAYQQSSTINSNQRRVYASRISQYNLKDARILRSDDGGQSFSYTSALPHATHSDNTVITKIVIHPTDPDLILVLSSDERDLSPLNALYMSANGGDTWTKVARNIDEISDVVFHPIAPHYVFISNKPSFASARVYSSNLKLVSEVSNDHWETVFTTPVYDNEFYEPTLILWPENTEARTIRAINISTTWQFEAQTAWRISYSDSQQSWQQQGLGESSDWSGDDENWNLGWSKNFTIFSPNLESLNSTLGFDASDSDSILWTTNQFVHRGKQLKQGNNYSLEFENLATTISDDRAWSSTGLDNITPFILDVNAADPDVIYAGLNDLGCTVSRDGGKSWNLCIHNNGSWLEGFNFTQSYGGVVTALISDPKKSSRVWMFAAGDQGEAVIPLRSDDYGKNWSAMNWASNLPATADIYGLSLDTESDQTNRQLYVTVEGAVYRSQDHGGSWSQIYACDAGCRVTKTTSNGMLVAGGEAGLFISKDNGANWLPVLSKSQIAGFYNEFVDGDKQAVFDRGVWAGVSGIAIDSEGSNIVYAAVLSNEKSQGVYKCNVSDGFEINTACQLVLKNTPYIRDIAVDPFNSQNLYAVSSSAYTSGGFETDSAGVLRSTDGGTTWKPLNDGLDWPMALTVKVNPQNNDLIYIGSPGGGNYKIDLSSADEEQEDNGTNTGGSSGGGSISIGFLLMFFCVYVSSIYGRSLVKKEVTFFIRRKKKGEGLQKL